MSFFKCTDRPLNTTDFHFKMLKLKAGRPASTQLDEIEPFLRVIMVTQTKLQPGARGKTSRYVCLSDQHALVYCLCLQKRNVSGTGMHRQQLHLKKIHQRAIFTQVSPVLKYIADDPILAAVKTWFKT